MPWCQTAFQNVEHERERLQAKIDKDEIHAIGKRRDKGIAGTRMTLHQMVQTCGSQIALSRRGFFGHLIQRKNAASRVLRRRGQMQSGIPVRRAKFDQRPRPLVNRGETQIMRHLWAGRLEAQRVSRSVSPLLPVTAMKVLNKYALSRGKEIFNMHRSSLQNISRCLPLLDRADENCTSRGRSLLSKHLSLLPIVRVVLSAAAGNAVFNRIAGDHLVENRILAFAAAQNASQSLDVFADRTRPRKHNRDIGLGHVDPFVEHARRDKRENIPLIKPL